MQSDIVLTRARNCFQALPDPVDAFAVLYDVLAAKDAYASIHPEIVGVSHNPQYLSTDELRYRNSYGIYVADKDEIRLAEGFRSEVAGQVERVAPWFSADRPLEWFERNALLRIAYAARLIDWAFLGMQLGKATFLLDRLEPFQDRIALYGNLLQPGHIGGLVIPAERLPTRGTHLRHLFQSLRRIDRAKARYVDYKLGMSVRRGSDQSLRFGLIPTVLDEQDVEWRLRPTGYSVVLNEPKIGEIAARTLDLLDWFVDRKVDVVVLPELVSHALLRDEIVRWMRRKGSLAPGIIVAGSEAVEVEDSTYPVNRAFVLGSWGEPVWHQDKVHRYTMMADQVREAQLDSVLGESSIDEESAAGNQIVKVRDIPGVGRCMVLVCEDLAQPEPGQMIAREVGVDLLLVPVMDGRPSPNNHWWARHGINLAADPGALTAIANSYALMARMPAGATNWSANDIGRVFGPRPYPQLIDSRLGVDGKVNAAIFARTAR